MSFSFFYFKSQSKSDCANINSSLTLHSSLQRKPTPFLCFYIQSACKYVTRFAWLSMVHTSVLLSTNQFIAVKYGIYFSKVVTRTKVRWAIGNSMSLYALYIGSFVFVLTILLNSLFDVGRILKKRDKTL